MLIAKVAHSFIDKTISKGTTSLCSTLIEKKLAFQAEISYTVSA